MTNTTAVVLVVLAGFVLTLGDIAVKKWLVTGQQQFYVYGLLVYMVALNMVMWSFKAKNISVASMLVILVNVISFAVINWTVFGEKLDTTQMLGIALGLLAVLLLD